MANTLRFKRGLVSGIPTAALGEPLFTTDTFDLYIGNGTGNTRFQKYIASGTTSQLLRGDGSLLTMPIVLTSPSNGQVLKYDGTNWVNSADAGVTGSGANGQVTFWNSASTITGSNNLFWDDASVRLGVGRTPSARRFEIQQATGSVAASIGLYSGGGSLRSIIGIESVSTDDLQIASATGLRFYSGSTLGNIVTNPTNERFRVTSGGNFIINNASTDNGLRFQVTGDGYFSGSVGIGTTALTQYNLRVSKNISGATVSYGIVADGQVQSGVTVGTINIWSNPSVAASTTSTNLYHVRADQGAFGAGATITNQVGFWADSSLTGATNNFAFRGEIPSGTGRWNLYMGGTANNYMAGSLGIGTTGLSNTNLSVNKNLTGLANVYGIFNSGSIRSDVTTGAQMFTSAPSIQNAVFTLAGLKHFEAVGISSVGSATITTQFGFYVESTLTGATTNYGFYSVIAAATGRWNLFMDGTANNFMRGSLLIGSSTTSTGEALQVNGTMRVSGASTFGGNMGLTLNQNAATTFSITNGTNGTAAQSRLELITNAGTSVIGRNTSLNTPYKINNAYDFFIYNGTTNGDIAILNDFATGSIKMAAGGSSTAHFTIASTGAATFSSSVTAGGNLLLTSGTASSVGAINLIRTGTSPVASRLTFGTDGTGYSFAIGKNQGGTVTDLLTILDSGASTFVSSVRASGFNSSGGNGYQVINTASNTVTALRPTGGGTSVMSTNSNGLHIAVGTEANGDLILATNNTERIRLYRDGYLIHTTATNPASSSVDAYLQYSADVTAGNAAPHFRTENGAVIKLYQQTTSTTDATYIGGGGTTLTDLDTFDGYRITQIVKALRNAGILQ